jgi:predicted kinase
MARLILLNGPPACGKSTVAQLYVDDHPLALNLDLDRIRALIGQWLSHAHDSGLLTRDIALAAARTHLAAGHDVVVPQFLAQPGFIEQLDATARHSKVPFHEIVLLDSKENALRRFVERSLRSADASHMGARDLQDRSGGMADLAAMYDRLTAMVASRPTAVVVPSLQGQAQKAYQQVLEMIG